MERAIDLPIGVDDNIILKIGDLLTILGLGARYRLDQNSPDPTGSRFWVGQHNGGLRHGQRTGETSLDEVLMLVVVDVEV